MGDLGSQPLGTLHSIIAKQSMHAITNPTHLIKLFIHRLPVFHSGHAFDKFNLYIRLLPPLPSNNLYSV